MSYVVRNPTGGTVTIADLGQRINAAEEFDLAAGFSFDILNQSTDLAALLTAGTLQLLTGFGGTVIPAADATAVQEHKDSHEAGGSDELNVAGLSGLLNDAQTPLAHTHVAADVTDFQTSVSNNTDVGANTAHRNSTGNPHSADTDDIGEGSSNLYYTEGRVSANSDVAANSAHRVSTSNPHSVTPTQIGAIPTSDKGVANGVAELDGSGKVPTAQIPASALPSFSVVVNAAARLALVVQEGDEAYQTDDGSQWIYDGTSWFQRPVGTGDVIGPSSATDNALARFDTTTGKLIQNSAVTVDDSGNIATAGTVDGRDLSVDGAKLDGIEAGAEVDDKDVKVSANDTTPGNLLDKLVAGTGITLIEVNDGGNEQVQVNAAVSSTADIAVSATNSSNLDLTTSYQNIPLTQQFVSAGDFTVGANSITITNSGNYWIHAHIALFQNGGNNRTTGNMQITRNGALIPGMTSGFYSRNNADGEDGAAVGTFIACTAGDVIAIQAKQNSGSPDLFVQSAGLTIFSLKGPKGDMGPAGGSTVDVRDEGVSLGSFTTVNCVGAGITVTDAGGGVAQITVADTTVFGNDQQFVENTTESTTTSSTWQTHLTLNIPAGLTGTYRVGWGALIGCDSTDGDTEARLWDDTASVQLGGLTHVEPKDVDNEHTAGGVKRITLSGAAKTLQVQFRRQESPGTSRINHSYIEFWRVA